MKGMQNNEQKINNNNNKYNKFKCDYLFRILEIYIPIITQTRLPYINHRLQQTKKIDDKKTKQFCFFFLFWEICLPLRAFMCATAMRKIVSLSGLRANAEHVGTISLNSAIYAVILFLRRLSISQWFSLKNKKNNLNINKCHKKKEIQ